MRLKKRTKVADMPEVRRLLNFLRSEVGEELPEVMIRSLQSLGKATLCHRVVLLGLCVPITLSANASAPLMW